MTANKLEGKARELEQKWRESAAKLDRGFGPGDSILAAGKRQCADELAAVLSALDTARQPEGMVCIGWEFNDPRKDPARVEMHEAAKRRNRSEGQRERWRRKREQEQTP